MFTRTCTIFCILMTDQTRTWRENKLPLRSITSISHNRASGELSSSCIVSCLSKFASIGSTNNASCPVSNGRINWAEGCTPNLSNKAVKFSSAFAKTKSSKAFFFILPTASKVSESTVSPYCSRHCCWRLARFSRASKSCSSEISCPSRENFLKRCCKF